MVGAENQIAILAGWTWWEISKESYFYNLETKEGETLTSEEFGTPLVFGHTAVYYKKQIIIFGGCDVAGIHPIKSSGVNRV